MTVEQDLEGSEPVTGLQETDVKQETVASDPPPEEEKSVPYNRFKEVNDEKNKTAEENAHLKGQLEAFNRQAETKVEAEPEQDMGDLTVDSFKSEMEKGFQERIDSAIKPLQEKALAQTYNQNVNSFLHSNPEAKEVWDQIQDYTEKLSDKQKRHVVESVVDGDLTPLRQIFHTVKSEHNSQTSKMANDQVKEDVNRTFSPRPVRTRKVETTTAETIKTAKETGDFSPYWNQLAGQVLK